MTPNQELKPCPFCKGSWIPVKTLRDGYEDFQDDPDAFAYNFRCQSCACESPWAKSETSAIRWVNTRCE